MEFIKKLREHDNVEDLESLPIEELDPCCQKEINIAREKRRIDSRLRGVDRSYSRFDEKLRAFRQIKAKDSFNCECCAVPRISEYRMLDLIKTKERNTFDEDSDVPKYLCTNIAKKEDSDSYRAENDRDEESDDSLDEFGINDEFLTPYELQMREEMAARVENMEQALSIGYTTHCEDSLEHIKALVEWGTWLVCHIYRDTSLDAQLDIFLESIAKKNMGTKFRRCPITSEESRKFLSSFAILEVSECNGVLLVFRDKSLVNYTTDFYQFGGETLMENNVLNYLERCHVLSNDAPDVVLERLLCNLRDIRRRNKIKRNTKKNRYYDSDNEDDDEEEDDDDVEEEEELEIQKYCNDPTCTRNFPHEHITGQSGVSFGGKYGKDDGLQALAHDAFYRL